MDIKPASAGTDLKVREDPKPKVKVEAAEERPKAEEAPAEKKENTSKIDLRV